ncbi:MAG: WYL domain-containing protein [Clostridia bacterium]|nr:WYL domain-containing protein [Clostridia bacterium]
MPKKARQKLKLIRVRDILLENSDEDHPIGVPEIIRYLADYGIEAERKSIYEDIEELRSYGMDIEVSRGKGGGYFVASREFELPELKVLVDAVQASKFISAAKSRELIKKLSGMTSRYERSKLSRQVHITERVKSMNKSIYYTTDYIHTAISENRRITFCYFKYNSRKEKVFRHDGKSYEVSPWLLIWNDENYYLAAYDGESGKVKHFRVDKMERVALTDKTREGEEVFKESDVSLYSTGVFDMFGGKAETVALDCREEMAGAVIDRFGKDVTLTQGGDLDFRAYVRVQISPRFFGWVAGFGDKMKISSPDYAVEEFKKALNDIASLY